MFGHFELPHFYMNAMVQMPDHGDLKAEHFKHQEYVFSGHFHKRQQQGAIHYIGNAFPHNYADAWDDARGMMILDKENDGEPEYINWDNCPKYRTVKLSQLIDKTDEIIKSKMYLRVTLDIQISYEEANFIKETLFVFGTPEQMYAKEAEIVTEDFIAAENTYNLKVGGFGGFDYINKKGLSGTAAGVQKRNELMKDQVWVSEWAKSQQRGIKNISEARRQTMIDRRKKTIQKRFGKDVFPSFKGKKHTKKTREIIGEKNSKHQSGTKNSQFGTRWIYSNEHQISKKIGKDDHLPEGWYEGRKLKF